MPFHNIACPIGFHHLGRLLRLRNTPLSEHNPKSRSAVASEKEVSPSPGIPSQEEYIGLLGWIHKISKRSKKEKVPTTDTELPKLNLSTTNDDPPPTVQSKPIKQYIPEDAGALTGILSRCIRYIEEELDTTEGLGLYRISGNGSVSQILFSRLAEDPNTDIRALENVTVGDVTGTIKYILIHRIPPLISTDLLGELERVALITDDTKKSFRLLELKQFLSKLPPPNLAVLRLIMSHLLSASLRALSSKRHELQKSCNLLVANPASIQLCRYASRQRDATISGGPGSNHD